jgi:acyl CoA:acetate/3-ketoacid CoA transferase
VVNLGIGMSDGVANIAAEEGLLDDFIFSIEMGVTGGVPTKGVIFGAAWNPDCIHSMSSMFDFYHGGGLDMAFLGILSTQLIHHQYIENFAGRELRSTPPDKRVIRGSA